MTTSTQGQAANGRAQVTPEQQALNEAIAYEQAIAAEADAIWAEHDRDDLTAKLYYGKLRALLRRPIPPGFIQSVGVVTGKPYDSTGIKSVQVQMDRLDNVVRNHWGYVREFTNDGKLCVVTAWIGSSRDQALVERESYGGVDRGSTTGNVYKGSFTNAAKPAFARLGPGWEIYVGAADFDPDTDPAAAEQQGKPTNGGGPDPTRKLPADKVEPLESAILAAGLENDLPMKLRGFGVGSLEDLTVEQALSVYEWAKREALGEPEPDGEGSNG